MIDSQITNAANLIRVATVYMETLARFGRIASTGTEADKKLAGSMIFYAWRDVRDAVDICDADD